jgi:hypothetical protein
MLLQKTSTTSGMALAVEQLPSKLKATSSKPSAAKKKAI